jgi:hypothetical protein
MLGARDFSVLQNYPGQFWDSTVLLFSGYQGSLSGVKHQRHVVYHSPASGAEVKNPKIAIMRESYYIRNKNFIIIELQDYL